MHKHYGIYRSIRNSAWRCLLDFEVTSLPVDIRAIARRADVRLISNQTFPGLRRSDRGITYYTPEHRIIIYNEALPTEDIRFTVAHELGHLFLGHDRAHERYAATRDDKKAISEKQADQFAIRLLCPACLLMALDLHTPEEIAEGCHVPLRIAKIRAERMKKLYARKQFFTSPMEQRLYENCKPYIERMKRDLGSST